MFNIDDFNSRYRPNLASPEAIRTREEQQHKLAEEKRLREIARKENERKDAAEAARQAEMRARAWKAAEERKARAEAERARVATEQVVHRGPRGGKYRVVGGRKRYDVA